MIHKEWMTTPHRFRADDGFELDADVFEPPQESKGVAVLAGGTGIPRGFYRHFAAYLADSGYRTLSFDYRGIRGSRPATLRGFDATMSDWGRLDISAALAEAQRIADGAPLFYVGHSVGGQLLGLARGASSVQAASFIGSSTGTWWRMKDPSYRLFTAAIWYGFVPLTTSLLGYAPASWLGQGEDLPRGVAREWARWCRREDYFAADLTPHELAGYAALHFPLLSIGFTDDPIANAHTIPALLAHYRSVHLRQELLAPSDVEAKAVGHFGFFRATSKERLWTKVPAFFDATRGAEPIVAEGAKDCCATSGYPARAPAGTTAGWTSSR